MSETLPNLKFVSGRVEVTPLSINRAYQGRRFRTAAYDTYEKEVMYQLPQMYVPKGQLGIEVIFGLSSKLADLDNPYKLVSDLLQKRYKFNDRDVWEIKLEKEIVKKGEEYFQFVIYSP